MNELNVTHKGTLTGGSYDVVRIFADTIVTGNIHAKTLTIYEPTIFNGSVKANHLVINGKSIFNDEVMAQEITINETTQFFQDVKTNKLIVNKKTECHCEKIEAYETIINAEAVFNQLDAYQLTVNGFIACSRLLRCNHITFEKGSKGQLKEVMSSFVNIQPQASSPKPQVFIESLIAYDVTIRNTYIKSVKARKVDQEDSTIDQLDFITN
jgi:cytoskeletal protein CcmA (bactofilin family)